MPKKKAPSGANTYSYEINPNLFLVRQLIGSTTPTKPAEQPVNHIAVIDCSGSMAGDLPQIREQLKTRLPKLLKDGDTFSLIWFSGRGQFGALLEAEPVATLTDLQDVNHAIDRWLRPVGMTGFVEPLAEIEHLVLRVSKKNKNPFALFFMSDGCDNQWDRGKVLATVQASARLLASATFVEYGFYADRPLLAAMAAKAGGQHIFAEQFDKYKPLFEAKMQTREISGKRIAVKIEGDPIGGFVFSLDSKARELTTFEMNAGGITAPDDLAEFWYLSPKRVGEAGAAVGGHADSQKEIQKGTDAIYAAMSLFAVRANADVVWAILKALGDVRFVDMFASCFGKQKYSEFMEAAKVAAFLPTSRYMKGHNPNAVPKDDAFTVLDMLKLLTADDATRLLLDDSAFVYNRISRKRLDADDLFDDAEAEKIATLQAKMAGEKSATKLRELQKELNELLAAKKEPLKFVADLAPDGYPINGLVYNESRPNISLRVLKPGTIDISSRLRGPNAIPAPLMATIKDQFKTQIWRNYNLIRDGLVNMETLPVNVGPTTLEALRKAGVPFRYVVGKSNVHTIVIDVKPLPIINRKMVKSISAVELIKNEWELIKAKAAQKVYNHYVNEKFPGAKLKSFAELYGEDGAFWLKEQGITSNGFAPVHTKQAEATDVYMARELNVKLDGYNTLPSVSDIVKRLANPKSKPLAGAAWLVGKVMHDVNEFFQKNPPSVHQKWLTGMQSAATASARGLMHRSAELKYSVLVGNVWFPEFKSIDDNKLTVILDGQNVEATIEAREIEVEI